MGHNLTIKQKEALECLRRQNQPFHMGKIEGWGVSVGTLNALVRRGFVRPVLGGYTTKERSRVTTKP